MKIDNNCVEKYLLKIKYFQLLLSAVSFLPFLMKLFPLSFSWRIPSVTTFELGIVMTLVDGTALLFHKHMAFIQTVLRTLDALHRFGERDICHKSESVHNYYRNMRNHSRKFILFF